MNDSKLQTDRFLAMGIDIGVAIVLGIVGAIISTLFGVVAGSIGKAIGGLISGGIMAAYMALRDIIFKGNSIGKHIMKLKTVDAATGNPINISQSIKRNIFFVIPPAIGAIFSILTIIPFIGVILRIIEVLVGLAGLVFFIIEIVKIVSTPEGIRLGDNFANTKVVRIEG